MATKHHKTQTLTRALGGPHGLRLQTVVVDTDTLGTFTGDVSRLGTAQQVVVEKAAWACRASGLDVGIGSEGALFAHPEVGFLTMHAEHVALRQSSTGLTVIGSALDSAPWARSRRLATTDSLDVIAVEFGETWCRDGVHLIVRPESIEPATNPSLGISKGIGTIGDLEAAVARARACSASGTVVVETDLRAHCCPPRHRLILQAARDLAERLRTPCPECSAPGFGHRKSRRGAACAWCGGPTDSIREHVMSCPTCAFTRIDAAPDSEAADPGTCPRCNP